MHKIKAAKVQYGTLSEDDLNRDASAAFYRMTESLEEREMYLLDLNTKHQELKCKVETAEASLCKERLLLNAKLQELTDLDHQLNGLKLDKNTLLLEVHRLETQRNAIRSTKPNPKDQYTIEQGLKKFGYYKQLTGVRWDFGAPEGSIKGYVTNGSDSARNFNIKAHERRADTKDPLWGAIEKAAKQAEVSEKDEKERLRC